MNVTVNVASYYHCDQLPFYDRTIDMYNPIWRQTVIGCNILQILKDMYGFNVTYLADDIETNVTVIGASLLRQENEFIDLYIQPMSIVTKNLEYMSPIFAADMWSFGFILRRPDHSSYATFYSKPFSRPAWNCLYAMALFVSIMFYFLKKWEMKNLGGRECSYAYEILMVIGAYCQHVPPIEAKILSRRIAYFVFLMFAYIIYTYYTSNLLSHLVSDKGHGITLTDLPNIDLKIAIVDYIKFKPLRNMNMLKRNYSSFINNLPKIQPVSATDGIQAVKAGKMALLSDYTSLHTLIKKTFTDEEVCELSKIDIVNKIKKYYFTSKHFKYKEQFKLGALRIKESGIMNRLTSVEDDAPKCEMNYNVQTMFIQISIPIAILLVTCIICIFIMFMERLHYERNKVWPYIE